MNKSQSAKDSICRQIREIMQVYREQAASSYGVDTPGGLEHMGDVWRLLARWDKQLSDESNRTKGMARQVLEQ